jgi:thymidylate synthase
MFLGVPFNIASYALFTHMVAQVCNLEVGELIIVLGDAHIYKNHIEQVKEQLSRKPYDLPTVKLNPEISVITEFGMEDIELVNYQSHEAIRAEMAV